MAQLCPDCGGVMVWMRSWWKCQCGLQFRETRTAVRLQLRAEMVLPEGVRLNGDRGTKKDADRMLAGQGLQRTTEWKYQPDEHMITAWVLAAKKRQPVESFLGWCRKRWQALAAAVVVAMALWITSAAGAQAQGPGSCRVVWMRYYDPQYRRVITEKR